MNRLTLPLGTLVNMLTVVVGSALGLYFQQSFPPAVKQITFQGLGLVTLVLGMRLAFKSDNLLVMIFSTLAGGIMGVLLGLAAFFENAAANLQALLQIESATFVQGLTTAFILFCVGSMTMVGALNEGLKADRSLLYTKSVLDGFASIALASVYGVGVLFSILPMLIFQGGITLLPTRRYHCRNRRGGRGDDSGYWAQPVRAEAGAGE